MLEKTYRSIFISDIHLGSKGCKAEILCDFLKNNSAETLYLVGDIIDGWRLRQQWYWPQEHSNVIRRILTAAKRGTRVKYLLGNHDEVLRSWLNFIPVLGNLTVSNREEHIGVDGRRYLVVHGDMFDSLMHATSGRWLMHIGDWLYDFIIRLNDWWALLRNRLGLSYWSMSKWIKQHTKQAVSYVLNFEQLLTNYCHSKGYDGIICGHIHTPEIKMISGVWYGNSGDWVENCSALVEHHDGSWEIVTWTKERDDVDIDNTGSEHKQSAGHSRTSIN